MVGLIQYAYIFAVFSEVYCSLTVCLKWSARFRVYILQHWFMKAFERLFGENLNLRHCFNQNICSNIVYYSNLVIRKHPIIILYMVNVLLTHSFLYNVLRYDEIGLTMILPFPPTSTWISYSSVSILIQVLIYIYSWN